MISIPEKVQELLKTDSIRKNFRVHFPNGERADLTNNDIVLESVQFTESICSQNEIKLGLCESPVLSFDCVGVENINGVTIECSIEIDCSSLDAEWIQEHSQTSDDVDFPFYRIPYGVFVVQSCKRSTGRIGTRQVKAFNKVAADNWALSRYETIAETSIGTRNKTYNIAFPEIMYLTVGFPAYIEFSDYGRLNSEAISAYECSVFAGGEEIGVIKAYATNKVISTYSHPDEKGEYVVKYDPTFIYGTEMPNIDRAFDMAIEYAESAGGEIINPQNIGRIKKALMDFISGVLLSVNYQDYTTGHPITTGQIRAREKTEFKSNVDGLDLQIIRAVCEVGISFRNYYAGEEKFVIAKDINALTKTEVTQLANVVIQKDKKVKITEPYYGTSGEYWFFSDVISKKYSIRDLIQAFLEVTGYIGKFTRGGRLEIFDLQSSMGLTPSNYLTPSDDLFPGSGAVTYQMSNYRESWYDEMPTKPYDRVSCTVRDDSGNETYYYVDIVDTEAEGYDPTQYQTYSISDNYIIQNFTLTGDQIRQYMRNIADRIRTLQYLPADLDAVGLPNMEAGDFIEVKTANGSYQTLALKQTISGIQNLLADIVSN